MRKTMVYLEDDQYYFLKRKAAETDRPLAVLIREAVAGYMAQARGAVDYFSFVGIAEGPADEAVSENAEEILRRRLRDESEP